ncbi:MAG: PDZ domain-containing protein [Gemmatimonadaceae bacterium]
MRFTHLLALAAVTGAAANSADAQESRASTEARVRTIAPSVYRYDAAPSHRAALGVVTGTSGTLRDTLGILITSVTRGSPAEKAGIEEGTRVSAINGVSLRIAAADVEDGEMSAGVTRRLTRELGKSKPGDEVELRIYRDGKFANVKVKTADSDELFSRNDAVRVTAADRENRPALGIGLGSTGGKRDTLGVLVMSVSDSSPASKAGIEEGNRIASINGVNLRVAKEDAGDRWLGSTKAQRLQREISQLKVGENVTLKVYGNGQYRDVTLKVARAGDLPRSSGGMTIFGGPGFDGFEGMPAMPAMPSMPSMPMMPSYPMEPMGAAIRAMPMAPMAPQGVYIERMPELNRELEGMRTRIETMRPQLERMRVDAPRVRVQLNNLRSTLPRVMVSPRARVTSVRV